MGGRWTHLEASLTCLAPVLGQRKAWVQLRLSTRKPANGPLYGQPSLQYGGLGLIEQLTWQLIEYMFQQAAWPFINYLRSHRVSHTPQSFGWSSHRQVQIQRERAPLLLSVRRLSKNLLPCFITITRSPFLFFFLFFFIGE